MNPSERILDANANRAREAFRVIEDAVRFLFDDPDLASRAKHGRHVISHALERIQGLTRARNTSGDVGTRISTESETVRLDERDVVVAACRRVTEALRTIEEFAKIHDAEVAAEIESIRYVCYDIERDLMTMFDTHARHPPQWPVCVLISEDVCAERPWIEVARAMLDAPTPPACVQLREKHLDDAELLCRAEWLLSHAPRTTAIVINDRPDIALLTNAHGVHLGQTDLPCRAVRSLVGDQLSIGVSTSTLDEAQAAHRDGADYCGVGPMFPTTTKHKDVIVGSEYLRTYVAWGHLPHLAIGGVTPDNVGALVQAGCRGVAVSSSVCAAPDPAGVVAALTESLRAAVGTSDAHA